MRWLVAWGVVLGSVGCGGSPSGSNDDDGSGGGHDPTVDASTEPGGPTDASEPGGGSDASMPLPPLVQDTGGIEIMRADATHLYWARSAPLAVRRMPLEGGPIETLYTGPGWPNGLAVEGGFVYVAQRRGAVFNDEDLIVRFPVTGGAATTLVTPIGVRTLDVEDGWVYYGDTPDFPPRIMKVAVTGGTPHFIVRARANSIPYDLRADGGVLFYTDFWGITRVDVQTKRLTSLVDGLIPTQITVAGTSVYFVGCSTGECGDATAYRVPRDGGAYEPLGTGHNGGSRIDAIDDRLQWGSYVLSTTGGAEQTMLASQRSYAVAATPAAFYFGDRITGTIYRVAR